jgi:hypothetical protein
VSGAKYRNRRPTAAAAAAQWFIVEHIVDLNCKTAVSIQILLQGGIFPTFVKKGPYIGDIRVFILATCY